MYIPLALCLGDNDLIDWILNWWLRCSWLVVTWLSAARRSRIPHRVMTGIKAAITRTRSAARRVWTTAASRENTDVRVAVNGEDDAMLLRRSERTKERSASRPSIDDVTRISRGQRAKKRGTGSRMVCHRLNAEERRTYERATLPQHPPKNRVLVLHNGSNRRERKGSPLWNIYRLWCDSNAFPAVVCDLVRAS